MVKPSEVTKKAKRILARRLQQLEEEIEEIEQLALEANSDAVEDELRAWWAHAVVDLHLTGTHAPLPDHIVKTTSQLPTHLKGERDNLRRRWVEAQSSAQDAVDDAYEDAGQYWLAPDLPKQPFPDVGVWGLRSTCNPDKLERSADWDLDVDDLVYESEDAHPWLLEQWEKRGRRPPPGRLEPPPAIDADSVEVLRHALRSAAAELHLFGDRLLNESDEELTAAVELLARWSDWIERNRASLAPGSPEDKWRVVEQTGSWHLSGHVERILAALPDLDDPEEAIADALEATSDVDERWQLDWLAERWRARGRLPPPERLNPPPSPAAQAATLRAAREERERQERAERCEAAAQAKEVAARRASLQGFIDAVESRLTPDAIEDATVTDGDATIALGGGATLAAALSPDDLVSWTLRSLDGDFDGLITCERVAAGELDPLLDAVGASLAHHSAGPG